MALDPRKRQKKLERIRQKAKAKRKAATERDPRNWTACLERSPNAPIFQCFTTTTLWDEGIANVVIGRKLYGDTVAFAAFLVDRYCLGVKDATCSVTSRSSYDRVVHEKMARKYEIVNLEPSAARKLIEGAVEYARSLGLSPHADYREASLIFGDIDSSTCREEFPYGKDGKPFFIAGPYDSPSRCQAIMNTLTDRLGSNGFHFLMPMSDWETPAPG